MIIGLSGLRDDGSSAGAGKDEVARILEQNHGFVIVALADEMKRTVRRIYDFTITQLWGPSAARNAPDTRYPREHGPWVGAQPVGEDIVPAVCACCGKVRARVTSDLQTVIEVLSPPSQCYLTARFVLQQLGTEFGRTVYPDTWVRYTLNVAREVLSGTGRYSKFDGLDRHFTGHAGSPPEGVVIPDVRWPAQNEGQAIKKAGGLLYRIYRPGTNVGTLTNHRSEQAQATSATFDGFIHNDATLEDLERRVAVTLGQTAVDRSSL